MVGDRVTAAITVQQSLGTPGQHPPHFPTPALGSGDFHIVIAGGLVSHPGDHGGFGAISDRNPAGTGNGAAADRRGVSGDGVGQPPGEFRVFGVKVEELQYGGLKILDVFGLCLVSPFGVGGPASGVAFGGAFGQQLGPDPLDRFGRGPDAARKQATAPLFPDDPVIAGRFHASCQAGVARRQQFPACGHGHDAAIGVTDRAVRRPGSEHVLGHALCSLLGWFMGKSRVSRQDLEGITRRLAYLDPDSPGEKGV